MRSPPLHIASLKVFLRLFHNAIPLTRFSAFLPPVSILPHSSEYILHPAVVLLEHSRASCMDACVRKADFPMGPQVKTGTHSVRRGTPSVPVDALARGEPRHPSSLPPSLPLHPSIPPSVHPLAIPPSRGSTVLNHPGMQTPLSLPLSPFFPLVLPPSRH